MAPYKKPAGPISISNIGCKYKDNTLSILLDAAFLLGPIRFTLIGLSIDINFKRPGATIRMIPLPIFSCWSRRFHRPAPDHGRRRVYAYQERKHRILHRRSHHCHAIVMKAEASYLRNRSSSTPAVTSRVASRCITGSQETPTQKNTRATGCSLSALPPRLRPTSDLFITSFPSRWGSAR